MKILLFGTALSLSASLLAGQATITGVGRVAAQPEMVVLSIDVNAECYPTPSEATRAADKIASEIKGFLDTRINHAADSREDVLTNGGYTQPFSKYINLPNGQSQKACIGTFQKRTSITLKTVNVKDFGLLFDEIQEMVYGQYVAAERNEDSPVAYATIGTPATQLFHETETAKEREAQNKAVEDAIAKFEALFVKNCGIFSYGIVGFSEPGSRVRDMPYERVQESMGAGAAPINFDAHWVKSSINVEFQFEGGHCH